jgi:hypothetical protein
MIDLKFCQPSNKNNFVMFAEFASSHGCIFLFPKFSHKWLETNWDIQGLKYVESMRRQCNHVEPKFLHMFYDF